MPRIGVTGHARLSRETVRLVYDALLAALRPYTGPDLVGVTCLCPGADQLFARAIIEVQGRYEVVLPAADYRDQITPASVAAFDDLLTRAERVSWLPFTTSDRTAFKAASDKMLDRSEQLVAIWDGAESARLGDTADVVRTAQRRRIPVIVIWPQADRGAAERASGGRFLRPALPAR